MADSPQSQISNLQLDQLVDAVLVSPKYQSVCPDFIRSIGSQELAKRRSLKDAVKATKNKLHQVGGAYLEGEAHYAVWLDELRKTSQSGNRGDFLNACMRVMSRHSSTRERLALLDRFYATTLAGLPPLRSVLDVACGLNPLAIPWMPLAENAEYYAVDIYQDMVDFLNRFMALLPIQGHAQAGDVLQACPAQPVDVAFVLKTLPCLEQVDKAAGRRLLDAINADHLLVSFPVHSLGGRSKGMAANYEARFRKLVADKDWVVKRFEFATELVFRVSK